ncbi:MAG: allantoinase AllB [Gemmatimonadota bacterium]
MTRLRSRRVITPAGERAADIVIESGAIAAVTDIDAACAADVEYGELVLLPGLVDTHVHTNECGRTEWEGIVTATRAAAAGGVTTLIDMPLNSIPATIDVEALKQKVMAARGRCHVDVGFWGGVVPDNTSELSDLLAHGVFGFKCFMVNAGVPEFDWMQTDDLRRVAPVLRRLDATLLAHAEWPFVIEEAALRDDVALGDSREYEVYLRSRPADAEIEAIEYLIDLVREFGCRVHIVHLAAPAALPAIEAARAAGLPITVETCPHYLTFSAEKIPDGATQFKCAPPIRAASAREKLWAGLERGAIDLVVSDHSPCPPVMKQIESGDFLSAWGGIASLQLGLRIVWTGAAARGFAVRDVVKWMSEAPARLAGLEMRKGGIAPGRDADIVVFDPDAIGTVRGAALEHRHKLTPYEGMQLRGKVHATYLRGERVYDGEGQEGSRGEGAFAEPRGRLLRGME